MAKRRILKKTINGICGELFREVLLHKNEPNILSESQERLIKILHIQDEFIARINHTEKGNERKFYTKLRTDFDQSVAQIINKLYELK